MRTSFVLEIRPVVHESRQNRKNAGIGFRRNILADLKHEGPISAKIGGNTGKIFFDLLISFQAKRGGDIGADDLVRPGPDGLRYGKVASDIGKGEGLYHIDGASGDQILQRPSSAVHMNRVDLPGLAAGRPLLA